MLQRGHQSRRPAQGRTLLGADANLGSSLGQLVVLEIGDQSDHGAMFLAGLGADVIKVEPRGGSPTRNDSVPPGPQHKRQQDLSTGRQRRRAIILKALRQCLTKKGLEATALNDVASAAGMSPSALLYYYPNLHAIVVG